VLGFEINDYICVPDPFRCYRIVDKDKYGYMITYVGPGDNRNVLDLIPVRFDSMNPNARLLTKAERLLYVRTSNV